MIFIFGTGYHGRAAFRVCKRINIKIYGFLENDKKKISSFDLIYSANTITHIKNLDNVFKSINV